MTVEYLLRRMAGGDRRARARSPGSTLDKMADGGIHDQLGGGFHRYATDAIWLVPHFEQMLYDNAQLARVYLHAWAVTGDARYREVATGVLDYLVRELTTDDGAFAASQDADTDGVEGLTFTWRAAEIREVLGDDAPPFLAAYGVTDDGNWEGVDDPVAGLADAHTPRAVARGRRLRSGASRHRGRGSSSGGVPAAARPRRQGARGLERAGDRGLRRRAAASSGDDARYTARGRRAPPTTITDGLLAPDGVARPLVEGRPGGRPGRPRGLRGSRRRPAGPVRGDLRRALVRDRPGAHGPRPGALRRPGRRLLRHRRRPRAARHPAQGRAGQRRPVGQRDGDAGPAPAGGVDRRRRAIATPPNGRCGRSSPFVGALPDRVRPVARRRWTSRWRRVVEVAIVGDPADPATRALLAEVRPRLPAEPGRGGRRRTRARPPSRCSPTASPSTAGRPPMSAAASSAACR